MPSEYLEFTLVADAGGGLLSEKLEPRQGLPPLLTNLADRRPESLHYLGASFGLTQGLLNFWRKSGFAPVYLRQNASDITGDSPCHGLTRLSHLMCSMLC